MKLLPFKKNGTYRGYKLMLELLLNDGSSFLNFVTLTKFDIAEIRCLVALKFVQRMPY